MNNFLARWVHNYQKFLKLDSLSVPIQRGLLVLILLSVFSIRAFTIGDPSLDRTAWKEIDYLAISTNYWQHGYRFLEPELNWPAEESRVTPIEFPLVPFSAALVYPFFGYNAFSARLITLLAFLLMALYVFRIAKRELGPSVAILAALAAGVMPLYHPFGRFLFSEPAMIAMSVTSLYYVAEWIDNNRRRDGILALLTLSLAFAIKIESLYMLLPVCWLAYRKYKWEFRKYKNFLLLIFLSLLLPISWYSYAYFLETSGVQQINIFQGHNKFQTFTMLIDLEWYHLMARRVVKGICGGFYGTFFCLLGILSVAYLRKASLFFYYLIAIAVYFAIVAEGHIDAPYRQMTIIPPLSVFFALGVLSLLSGVMTVAEKRTVPVIVTSMFLISLVPAFNYKKMTGPIGPMNKSRWNVAGVLKTVTPPESKIITIGEYTTHVGGYDISPMLFHYSERRGWILTPENWSVSLVENLREKGATHFVAMPKFQNRYQPKNVQPELSSSFVQEMKARFPTLVERKDLLILDLKGD